MTHKDLSEILRGIMLDIAMLQPDPAERDAMLEIMRKDGWLPQEEEQAA